MTPFVFSAQDRKQLKQHGLSAAKAAEQLRCFKKGFSSVKLVKPCTVYGGIRKLTPEEQNQAEKKFKKEKSAKTIIKFVPASGAASRMFHFLEEDTAAAIRSKEIFFKNISKLAFYNALSDALKKSGKNIDVLIRTRDNSAILKALLEFPGLGYRYLPKGMILFHRAAKGTRTAFEEQLDEAILFAGQKNKISVHFTLPASARKTVRAHLQAAAKKNRKFLWNIQDSIQSPATDCLAAEKNGSPARDEKGKLLLRPAGHGALLRNLNQLRADLIYVKNIDNILPQRQRREADRWKKILCGVFLAEQENLFRAQKIMAQKTMLPEEALFVLKLAREWGWSGGGRKDLSVFLNRPLRVCGMVPNTGEPGGGPFWTKDKNGGLSAQIVEKAEVNLKDKKQEKIWRASTHFNPVDFVCGVYDWRGQKYHLEKFTDPERGLISQKTHGGSEIRAMELPGLWNGGMSDWVSLFVEIPAEVFAPVKTVLDLLRPEHQEAGKRL